MLAREDAALLHGAAERQAQANGALDRARVQHRQHTRQAGVDDVDVRVGRVAEARARGGEQLRVREELHVTLEADRDVPTGDHGTLTPLATRPLTNEPSVPWHPRPPLLHATAVIERPARTARSARKV